MIEGVDRGLPPLPPWEPEWRTQAKRHMRWGVRECSSWTLLEHAKGALSARDVERIVKEANRMLVDGDVVSLVPVIGNRSVAAQLFALENSPTLLMPMTARLERMLYASESPEFGLIVLVLGSVRWFVACPCPPPLAILDA